MFVVDANRGQLFGGIKANEAAAIAGDPDTFDQLVFYDLPVGWSCAFIYQIPTAKISILKRDTLLIFSVDDAFDREHHAMFRVRLFNEIYFHSNGVERRELTEVIRDFFAHVSFGIVLMTIGNQLQGTDIRLALVRREPQVPAPRRGIAIRIERQHFRDIFGFEAVFQSMLVIAQERVNRSSGAEKGCVNFVLARRDQ